VTLDQDIEVVRRELYELYSPQRGWDALARITSRLRTAEAENAALIEGAANISMERDMANSENETLRAIAELPSVSRTFPASE
jgi:hypothetical protein